MNGAPVNPFALPALEHYEVGVLQPHLVAEHEHLYVDICGGGGAFKEFTAAFDVPGAREHGGFVLVVGRTGSGKSALVNRCAAHLRDRLDELGLRTTVLDLAPVLPSVFDPRDALSRKERIAGVGAELLSRLHELHLLKPGAEHSAADSRGYPWLLRRLHTVLAARTAVVVLLPSPGDLVDEVTEYAYACGSPRVVFLAESDRFFPEHIAHIRQAPSTRLPPTVVTLRQIQAHEVRLFVDDRLTRAAERGTFPYVHEDAFTFLPRRCRSVKRLQEVLFKTYQARLDAGAGYTATDVVTISDFQRFLD
ncbi:hypothetical protein [Actinokineospora sp. NBRC 105648]|uniref:hypothetical protein n=1 Tax=Actinokineospora sp. NBRC 105648 TaxID=3032206 RepID=UPI00255255DE|nr:hypothetical protein [Actinokineospora sp. NBRC 105648]